MNVIECRKVKKSYANKSVLQQLDLDVQQGEFFALLGINGCGKSTLIKAMLDLTAIDEGNIQLFGTTHRHVCARQHIAYLPDRFSPPAYLKVEDFIAYMLRLYGVKKNDALIESQLLSLGLEKNMLGKSVNQLSKGMTQKIGLAACLLSGRRLLILDEPMSGLDPQARVLFKRQLLAEKEKGISLFFSSHMLTDVEELADNMAVLHNGRILFAGSPQVFKERYQGETLEQAYMRCIA